MLKWEYNDGFLFSIEGENNEKIHPNDWGKYENQFDIEISIIQEFIDNGFGDIKESSVYIKIPYILDLAEIDKQILGLPPEFPFVLYIEPDGSFALRTFMFKFGFYDFAPNGNQLSFNREGPILTNESFQYIISNKQYKVIKAIQEFNSLPNEEKSLFSRLKRFSGIKDLAKDSAILLDKILASEDVTNPDKIILDVELNGEILELQPKIEGIEKNSFVKSFDLSSKIKSVYNTKNESGERTRVLIDENQKSQLEKIKKFRKIKSPEKAEDIVENPELYFDEDIIDLAFFSKRVREIGVYKPKFYPFISPYKSEWIPGFSLKDKVNGEKKITFKSNIELAEFEDQLEIAKDSNKSHFEFKGEKITIEDADKFIKIAKKQLENKEKPIISKESDKVEEVLIIKENTEFLEYSESDQIQESFEHNFNRIYNLKEGIQLKNHQVEGVAWLQTLYNKSLKGCLLADDMGLGKTLQLLYFIEWHTQSINEDKPYLIVAPVSILENWENEYKKFFVPQNLPLLFFHGKTDFKKEFSKSDVKRLQQKQIILTNYESLRNYQFNLGAVDYAIVALDEAQKIKTPGTMVTNVAKALKADFKIAMTGTPVENTYLDLWCIMDFSVPGLLSNAKEFAKTYQSPLKNENTDVQILGETLRNRIGGFIKRRLKEHVIDDLPKKELEVIRGEMPEKQLNRYSVEVELANDSDLEGIEKRNQILKSLWALRDISDHPYLVDKQIHKFDTSELISTSAKLQILIDILYNVELKREKAIVFADRRATQKMLRKVIFDSFDISPPSIINGDTPSSKSRATKNKLSRQQTIDRFQSKPGFNVIIMSPLAAGVGLNIIEANHVIHYSRHWNPAKEEQATDRAYRIGQKRDVKVYYPMAVFPSKFTQSMENDYKSFDEILDTLLSRKRTLASSSLFPTERVEVRPDELADNVFSHKPNSYNDQPLEISDIDKISAQLFEAAIGALYKNKGFTVYLTPFANDKGADVIALSETENFLIQAKQSKSLIRNDAVQEIVTAVKYYSNKFGKKFTSLVLTNNFLGNSATTLANANDVKIIERYKLQELLIEYPINLKIINQFERGRLLTV